MGRCILMKIITHIPETLYHELQETGMIYPKTNYSFAPTAYGILKDISKMDNFFFGVASDRDFSDDDWETAGLKGNPSNTVKLTLEVPDDTIFIHDFYTFSDLIYYTDHEPNDDITRRLVEAIKHQYTTPNDYHQVIFPRIEKTYIIESET